MLTLRSYCQHWQVSLLYYNSFLVSFIKFISGTLAVWDSEWTQRVSSTLRAFDLRAIFLINFWVNVHVALPASSVLYQVRWFSSNSIFWDTSHLGQCVNHTSVVSIARLWAARFFLTNFVQLQLLCSLSTLRQALYICEQPHFLYFWSARSCTLLISCSSSCLSAFLGSTLFL